jgi:LVIVD repeat
MHPWQKTALGLAGLLLTPCVVGFTADGPREFAPAARALAPGELERERHAELVAGAGTCLNCHIGIEDIHPGYQLSCVDCHGGNDTATAKNKAHVLPVRAVPNDERVLPQRYDLPYQRFKNPSNLRVAMEVCGTCHEQAVSNMLKSPHATTSGHLGDGFYENGLVKNKKPGFSIFPVKDEDGDVPANAIASTTQVPGFKGSGAKNRIETHYSDLARKACMHCHLYSEGRAVDGRLGLDGDYRGEGCAACHVTYAENGLSQSGDKSADRREPGHARTHRFTSKIPTSTCVSCHYGDASIGLHFRGMAQLVPGMPAGPQVKGTTDHLLNGQFYIRDDHLTPPDVHHAKGMHCIDCHTVKDVMGDGNIYPQMDFAVEIECTSCHGTYDRVTDLTTSKGRRVSNLRRDGKTYYLISKVTGKKHKVKQVKHVVDKKHADYNARGAAAMNDKHTRLECYTCHNGWNVNFFGFHFDRNEQFTQLDLISGRRTPGRVTTQEKVFATFNQLRLGFNYEGMIAPYLVGFSTIGSAHDKDGTTILHQATPETAKGLSGVTMIPHQMHTTRPEARSCVECHRSSTTWGLGSTNFRLTREFGYAVNPTGLHSIALDTKNPGNTRAVGNVNIAGAPRALGVRLDPVHARATHAYVGCEDGTLAIVSLRNPVLPRLIAQKKRLADPRDLLVQGDHLYVADGVGGLLIFDIDAAAKPKLVGTMPTTDARDLALSYPWLIIADGAGGLLIADVSDPRKPKFLSSFDLNGESARPNEAFDVKVLFQYSRTRTVRKGVLRRTLARNLAFVGCGLDGVRILDITNPKQPIEIAGAKHFRFSRGDISGVAVNTVFDVGSAGGGLESRERDYLYVYADQGPQGTRQQRVYVYDVSDPERPRQIEGNPRVYGGTGKLELYRTYNAPFLQHFVVAAGTEGIGTLVDVSKNETGPTITSVWGGIDRLRDLEFEEFAFDRLQDERGRMIKDISHEGCRYLTPDELLKVLRAEIPKNDYQLGRYGRLSPTIRRRRGTRRKNK